MPPPLALVTFDGLLESFAFVWKAARGKDLEMLVLSRKRNESIVINDRIRVVVVAIRDNKVRLGVQAPKEVTVHRREVLESIQQNLAETNVQAVAPSVTAGG